MSSENGRGEVAKTKREQMAENAFNDLFEIESSRSVNELSKVSNWEEERCTFAEM